MIIAGRALMQAQVRQFCRSRSVRSAMNATVGKSPKPSCAAGSEVRAAAAAVWTTSYQRTAVPASSTSVATDPAERHQCELLEQDLCGELRGVGRWIVLRRDLHHVRADNVQSSQRA